MEFPKNSEKSECRVFLSYANPDLKLVCSLYEKLREAGFMPWMNKKDILAGENWRNAINRAMKQADFILLCFSSAAIDYEEYSQMERKIAELILKMLPYSTARVIPIRLTECEIPEPWDEWQWIDLFDSEGFDKLMRDMRELLKRRSLRTYQRGEWFPGQAFFNG